MEIAPASIPKLVPHILDWKDWIAGGTGRGLIPSLLRFGTQTNRGQAWAVAPPDPAVDVGVTPKSNGSGDVVDDSFHNILQYPFSVLIQFWYC